MSRRPMIGSLLAPQVMPATYAVLGTATTGSGPLPMGLFNVTFDDAALTLAPLGTPAPATFAVAFGDGTLTITA